MLFSLKKSPIIIILAMINEPTEGSYKFNYEMFEKMILFRNTIYSVKKTRL